jgi:Transcriptional regulator
MDKFAISSDDCLILKAFKDSNSLREAAVMLGVDPAGLARRVQHISSTYGFLQKVNNRWQVTARGLDLVAWTESSIQAQKKILSAKSSLRIATTMWFSEEVLIPNLKSLQKHLGGNTQLSLSVPNKSFELSLIDGSVDFVIVCHPPENPEIEHKQLILEEWVLIAPPEWKKDLRGKNIIEFFKVKPFIRHQQINEDIFLKDFGTLTDSGITIDNLIGIRSAVTQGLGWSVVPKLAVRSAIAEGKLLEVPYEIHIQDRKVCLWWLRNRYETRAQSSKLASWIKELSE